MFRFKKRSKADVASKSPFSWGITKNGKEERSGVVVTFKDNDSVTLLTPSGKARKYAQEIKEGRKLTNNMEVIKTRKGKDRKLRDTERAYRSGYLAARSDSSKAYNAKQTGGK